MSASIFLGGFKTVSNCSKDENRYVRQNMDDDFDFQNTAKLDDDRNDDELIDDMLADNEDEDELLILHNEFNNAESDTDNELNVMGPGRNKKSTEMIAEDTENEEEVDQEDEDFNVDANINLDEVEFDEPPEHGIIVIGKILSAFDLNIAAPPSSQGQIFFKILFSAETSRSTTFRCKTPMFTSSPVPYSLNPAFDQCFFKFETILPLTLNAATQATGPQGGLYGEIIISLLYINDSGVQQSVGEVCFDLST